MERMRRKRLDPDGIVPWLTRIFPSRRWDGLIAGVGEDDCGVIRLGKLVLVTSMDFINATPIAEQLDLGGASALGRLAVAATVADLLGSGARPKALLVGATLPHHYPEAAFKQIMRGVQRESDRWHVPVIGGDTKLGENRALLACGFGTANSERELFLAKNAQPGDVLFSSGNLGTCAAATCIAQRANGKVPRWAVRAITVPQLPVLMSRRLANLRIANGGMDISDGLAADLHRMCELSGVGAILEADRIPLDSHISSVAKLEGVYPWAFAIASGGDYQFMVSVPPRFSAAAERLGFKRIGVMTRNRQLWITDKSGARTWHLPRLGHRDRKGQRFTDEIRLIIRQVTDGRKATQSPRQN